MENNKKIEIQKKIIEQLTEENKKLADKVIKLETEISIIQNKSLEESKSTKKLVEQLSNQKMEFEEIVKQLKSKNLEYDKSIKEIILLKQKYKKEMSAIISDIEKNTK